MAADAEVAGEAAEIALVQTSPKPENDNANEETDNCTKSDPKSELKMRNLVDMLSNLKLNPMAKEFFPSCFHNQNRDLLVAKEFFPSCFHNQNRDLLVVPNFAPANEHFGYNGFFDNTRVVDCRICGDPHSRLRFAFVEFADDRSAREAINFSGTIIGFYPIKVLPSKTAILPVNPTFLPQSEDEREMCARTVYCTNIDKQITQAEVKFFFESCCGVVTRLRLLGDNTHSTRIAFVEFVMAESAIAALDCSGKLLGAQPIRVSPSKTPVRPRVLRHPQN